MKTRIVGACLFLSLVLPAAAQTRTDYKYYKVQPMDTVESIAFGNGVTPEVLLAMNPELRKGKTPQQMVFVFIPVEPPPAPVARPAGEKPKVEEKEEPVAASDGDEELSDAEAALLAEQQTTGMANWGGVPAAPGIPVHRNLFFGSDGSVVVVPSAPPPPPPEPSPSERKRMLSSRSGRRIQTILKTARTYMGVPYVWGGESPSGFDCSGYLQHVYAANGIALPRTADLQYNVGRPVKRGEEKPGDMVFFETYCPGPSHCGIYLGRGYFIHASSSRGVTVSNLSEDFYAARYLGAKRMVGKKRATPAKAEAAGSADAK